MANIISEAWRDMFPNGLFGGKKKMNKEEKKIKELEEQLAKLKGKEEVKVVNVSEQEAPKPLPKFEQQKEVTIEDVIVDMHIKVTKMYEYMFGKQ